MLSLINAYQTPYALSRTSLQQERDVSDAGQQAPNQNTAQTANSGAPTTGRIITDTLDLSPAAQQAVSQAPHQPSLYHERFYPVQPGFSGRTLALSVSDPSAQPFSQNRPFADVAAAARASLDTASSQLAGQRTGGLLASSLSLEDRNSLFSELDRRALFAVASNEGGLFTKPEQRYARDIMRQQQGNALGFASGPNEAARGHADPFLANNASRFEAGVHFLDAVSVEEKALDIEWATQRAATQRLYETETEKAGNTPTNLSSPNPLVKLIQSILEQRAEDIDAHRLNSQTFRPILEGHEGEIATALAENRTFYAVS